MSDEKKKNQTPVDHDAIRQLAALLEETDLTEIEVEQAGLRVRVSRQAGMAAMPAAPIAQPAVAAPSAPATPPSENAASDNADITNHPGLVTSPMVGTAYLAPQPGAPSFVKVGDTVTEGQTLMIVEAMKTMNPIAAPKPGRVTQILIENEEPVEFGEPLAIIE